MNYIGSKIRLSNFIYETIIEVAGKDLHGYTFCDLFAGTGTVGKIFRGKVKKIISNDREYYSYILNRAYWENPNNLNSHLFIEELNKLQGCSGFIFDEYSENGKAGRLYFSQFNGQKIDAIRQKIQYLKNTGLIDETQYFSLLASLIIGADKVANTASVYSAYLKQLKTTATKKIKIKPVGISKMVAQASEVFQEDSNSLIRKIKGDILYLDPPYNGREYAANYHLLNTIAMYDNTFIPKGKTGIRYYQTSSYCRKREAAQALADLVENAKFHYLFLSYNNEGFIPINTIRKIMSRYGKYKMVSIPHPRFRSQKHQLSSMTTEYIHILSK